MSFYFGLAPKIFLVPCKSTKSHGSGKNQCFQSINVVTDRKQKNVFEVAKFFFEDILKFFCTMDDKIK